jgi:hypothetical protein
LQDINDKLASLKLFTDTTRWFKKYAQLGDWSSSDKEDAAIDNIETTADAVDALKTQVLHMF